MWDANVSLGNIRRWSEEPWRDWIPPVPDFVMVKPSDVPGDTNLICIIPPTWLRLRWHCPQWALFAIKVFSDLEMDTPNRLPVGAGGGREPSYPQHMVMGRGGVPPGLWDQLRGLSILYIDVF